MFHGKMVSAKPKLAALYSVNEHHATDRREDGLQGSFLSINHSIIHCVVRSVPFCGLTPLPPRHGFSLK
jgi:hypothetical protein